MEAKIDNYSGWIRDCNPETLKSDFEDILIRSGFGIINFIEHHFEPQGYTGLWLISESHFAIHTFPEEGKTYIELSSCNSDMYDDFLSNLKKYRALKEESVL
ncbi:MAG: S-adenosylmethionine decarboxylase [Cyclobacteriaceae bacterium]